MREVKYTGKTVTLGEFGKVKDGDVLDMLEFQWRNISDDKRFKLVTPKMTEGEREHYQEIKPIKTPSCDLSTIPWGKENLHNTLAARFSKKSLLRIIEGIQYIKGYISETGRFDSRVIMVDRILEGARVMGWDTLSKEDIEEANVEAERERLELIANEREEAEAKALEAKIKAELAEIDGEEPEDSEDLEEDNISDSAESEAEAEDNADDEGGDKPKRKRKRKNAKK